VPNASVRADVTGGSPMDIQGVLIYVMAYLFMNLGAFAVVVAVGKRIKSNAIESYAGLMKHAPFYASALTIFLVSLAGVPPTAGFLGKLFVFGSAIDVGSPEMVALAVLGVVNSVISAFYYLNVVRLMFFMPAKEEIKVVGGSAVNTAIIIMLVLTLTLAVFARPVSDITADAVYTHNVVHILSR
jgi:NADH-quinone oxidoreductase subunit N